jgi:hypothetical protein
VDNLGFLCFLLWLTKYERLATLERNFGLEGFGRLWARVRRIYRPWISLLEASLFFCEPINVEKVRH